MPPRSSPLQQLARHKLGRPLDVFVRVRLAEGLGWRRIADDLHRDSGVRVSHESLRSWFPQEDAPPPAAAGTSPAGGEPQLQSA